MGEGTLLDCCTCEDSEYGWTMSVERLDAEVGEVDDTPFIGFRVGW